jgi:hypothetical protein
MCVSDSDEEIHSLKIRATTPRKLDRQQCQSCGTGRGWRTYALAQARRLLANLLALGGKRLAAVGLVGLAVFATSGLSGYYLSRPTTEPLYSGLDRDDVIGIGSALGSAAQRQHGQRTL